MLFTWIKSRKVFVAVGIAVVSWATFQTEGIASGEFLTDRIGEGSILRSTEPLKPGMDGKVLYFQNGQPLSVSEIKSDQPFCKFESTGVSLGEHLKKSHQLVVKFKNVAKARWFFDGGIQLECMNPSDPKTIHESDFNAALGNYFQVEKHANLHPSWADPTV